MFPERESVNFKSEYPDMWSHITQNNKGFVITQEGIYAFTRITPGKHSRIIRETEAEKIVSAENSWYIMSYTRNGAIKGVVLDSNWLAIAKLMIDQQKLSLLIIFAASVLVSVLMTNIKLYVDKVKYYSFDKLTGVYNRRSGFELLEQKHKAAKSKSGYLSLCYIDVNGLKQVNERSATKPATG